MAISKISSGVEELDHIIDFLHIGDNVVWQVDSIEDYKKYLIPYVERSVKDNRKVIYLHFAQHEPLVDNNMGVKVYNLDAFDGFEAFTTDIHNIITEEGKESFYVFDCLSELLYAWATDLMIGNFFYVTCPYLYELNTIAYFAILRNKHSYKTVARIRETTQLLVDVYNIDNNMYIHPLKVWQRYSPTMFLPHVYENNKLVPITDSVEATTIFASMPNRITKRMDYWDRMFYHAYEHLKEYKEGKSISEEKINETLEHLCEVIIGREDRILTLAKSNFKLEDLINIKSRLIGSGYIGGKAVGMLLARKILVNEDPLKWINKLEPHDSFYIGSDVFYTYIVQNGCWKLRIQQKKPEGYFKIAPILKEKLLNGKFPDEIEEQFEQMLDYFGQSPIIVRSSSLLEDGFGNAFAGKYESVFCVNQGTPKERFNQFSNAVRKVFSSTMNDDALTYRYERNLADKDEQMALLVQRVSGVARKKYFFPYMAGVGNSQNVYVWKDNMDPNAGMIRLVFGLGTRAVDRVEGDYPRVIALDHPLLKVHAGIDDTRKYSQHLVDLLDVEENKHKIVSLNKLMGEGLDIDMSPIGILDNETNQKIKQLNIKGQEAWILTFDKLLKETDFVDDMKNMLKTLEKKYQYPVDVEFTVNYSRKGELHINLVQCRPLQTKGENKKVNIPKNIENNKILFKSTGNFMGGNVSQLIKRIIYVNGEKYSKLEINKKYEVARIIGRINKKTDKEKIPTILLGPGRWGTSTPSMGIPVRFSEINNVCAIGEVAFESAGLVPDLSFGSHFFQDLVELDIFYFALFENSKDVYKNFEILNNFPNLLSKFDENSKEFEDIIKVCDFKETSIKILSDIMKQKLICFFDK